MKYGLVIDPGIESGVVLFSWDDDVPYERIAVWQFGGAAAQLRNFVESAIVKDVNGLWFRLASDHAVKLTALIMEKFTPRTNEGFSLTLDSVEPLRCEGMMTGLHLDPFIEWCQPAQQYFMGDPSLPLDVKKRLAKNFLKVHNLYLTGKMVGGRPNADDAISATLHSIAWMRRMRPKHMPTIRKMFPETSTTNSEGSAL